jgi:lipid-binding SYLF domain-containing protein
MLATTFIVVATACATAPQTASDRSTLEAKAYSTLNEMTARDPHLHGLLYQSAGYIVLPEIGKAGYGVGGAWGRGVLFQHGVPVGFITLTQASAGFQVGAQSFAELIVISDPYALANVKAGKFELGGNISAVVITAGASAAARFAHGVAVFQMPRGGLMVEASVAGQRLNYSGG